MPGKFYTQSKSHYTSSKPDENTLTSAALKISAFVLHMQPLLDLCAYAFLCNLSLQNNRLAFPLDLALLSPKDEQHLLNESLFIILVLLHCSMYDHHLIY